MPDVDRSDVATDPLAGPSALSLWQKTQEVQDLTLLREISRAVQHYTAI